MPKKQERLTSLKDLADKFKESRIVGEERKTSWTKPGDFVVIIDGRDDRDCYHGRAGIVLDIEKDNAIVGYFDGKRRGREHVCANKPGALVPLTQKSWSTWRYRNIHMIC